MPQPSKFTPKTKAKEKTKDRASAPSKARRPISFHDQLVDDIYQRVNTAAIAKKLHSPFTYSCTDGVHSITFLNEHRFTISPTDRAVQFEKNTNGVWSAADHPQGSAIDSIMWPVRSVYMGGIKTRIAQDVSKMLHTECAALTAAHPEYKSDPELKKKLLHMQLVNDKRWHAKTHKFIRPQFMNTVKLWWSHFVDKDVLKAWVSVHGSSSRQQLSWCEYAAISRQPDLDDILNHLKSLGPERRMLRDIPVSEWRQHTAQTLLSPGWQAAWPGVAQTPPSVQNSIADALSINHSGFSDATDFSLWSGNDFAAPQTATFTPAVTLLGGWSTFASLAPLWSTPKKPREWMMAWDAIKSYSPPSNASSLSHQALRNHVEMCIKIFKTLHPKSYTKWSSEDGDKWRSHIKSILRASTETQLLFPNGLSDVAQWTAQRDHMVLSDILEPTQKAKTEKSRRM